MFLFIGYRFYRVNNYDKCIWGKYKIFDKFIIYIFGNVRNVLSVSIIIVRGLRVYNILYFFNRFIFFLLKDLFYYYIRFNFLYYF